MSFDELAVCRQRYERITGCGPPDEHLPSLEQLSGLRALLSAGRVPFVDFSIWSPLGARVAKFRRAEATVFVAGEFVTKAFEGPSTPAAWDESWALFSVAMVSLGAASPGNLNKYANGVRQLRSLFDNKWPLILTTDLVVRSERWGRLREDFGRAPPPGFDAETPWDYIIGVSAFGQDGPAAKWWETQFLWPASRGISSPAVAGMPQPGGSRQTQDNKRKAESISAPDNAEICQNWNSRSGKCVGRGSCPHGRRHVCSICGGPHRACDRHGGAPQDKGKGKGDKGKKGGKGKKGKDSAATSS